MTWRRWFQRVLTRRLRCSDAALTCWLQERRPELLQLGGEPELELGPVVQGGVQLSWSIFDGLLRSGRARQAEAKARALSAQRRATLQNLERELAGAQVRWRKARANLASAKQVLEHNKVYLRVARAARDSGAGTSLDVHNAELNLDRARIAIQRARFDGALARAQMQLIYGIAAGATR